MGLLFGSSYDDEYSELDKILVRIESFETHLKNATKIVEQVSLDIGILE